MPGIFEPRELCDDGNNVSGDGCEEDCQPEPFFTCRGAGPGSCTRTPGAWAQEAFVKEPRLSEVNRLGEVFAMSGDGLTLVIGPAGRNDASLHVLQKTATGWNYTGAVAAPTTGVVFGSTIALSYDGATLVVGDEAEKSASPGVNGDERDVSARGAGAAYVFVRSGTTWTQQAYLKASFPAVDDRFGARVAISADGNTVAVGAPEEDGSATTVDGAANNDGATNSGAVYTYSRSGTTWVPANHIKNPVRQLEGRFGGEGLALSADASTLAVGLPDVAAPTGTVAGKVVVFARSGATWTSQATLMASNPNTDDQFGIHVGLSADGSTLVAGAIRESSNGAGGTAPGNNAAPNAGAAYVFARAGTTWTQQAYLKAPDPDEDDYFGTSVAIAGDTIAVGILGDSAAQAGPGASTTHGTDEELTDGSGAVVVFVRASGVWRQESLIKASNPYLADEFGAVVALSANANVLAVGAPYQGAYSTGVNADQREARDRREIPQTYSQGALYLFSK